MSASIPNTLADSARADGLHDFQHKFFNGPLQTDRERNDAFSKSIVGVSVNNWSDEDKVLDAVFGVENWRRTVLYGLADLAVTAQPQTVITGYQYRVKRVEFIGSAAANAKTGAVLAEQINLDGSVLQIDFNHHSFLSRLKSGPEAGAVRVGYIWSAATINDPAGKTPPNDVIFRAGGEGITLIAHQQTSGSTTFVGGVEYDASAPTKNFVTKYDVELSGITQKVSFGRRGKDIVSIKFTDPASKRSVIIGDSKGQNSPSQLNSFINKLLANLGSEKAKFELATKWQQKRSGDWLQALHAALLTTMTFDPPLPQRFHRFFVSHDRIAIAYALAMGVSCLYFSDTSVYVFDNRPENPAAAVERCTARLDELGDSQQIRLKNWFFGEDDKRGHINGIIDVVKDQLDAFDVDVAAGCRTLLGPTVSNLSVLETILKSILSTAMKRVFLEKAFPDKATILNEIQSTDACVRYKSFATIESLYKQHGASPDAKSIPVSFFGKFQQTMVFKTLSDWTIEPKTTILSRVFGISHVSGGEQDNRDSFAFFPFIQNSSNARLKDAIADAFQAYLVLITPEKLASMGARTQSRQSRAMLGLSTLLKQGYVYLKSTQVPDAAVPELATQFINIAELPNAREIQEDNVSLPAMVNRMTLPQIIQSEVSRQEISDLPPDDVAGGGRGQVGGWMIGVRVNTGTEVDFQQCAGPLLEAVTDYAYTLGRGNLASTAEDVLLRRKGGASMRRSLYGGAPTVTQVMTVPAAPMSQQTGMVTPATVINCSLLRTTGLVVRDSYKLEEAPKDVLTYYAEGASLLAALADIEPTWPNASAVYALTTYCTYMTAADIAAAFSIDEAKAQVLRLLLSALTESYPLEPPTEPAAGLLAARETLSALWKALPPTDTVTPASVRAVAETTKWKIAERYGVKRPAIPGVGIVLNPEGIPGAPKTPEDLRAARIAAFGTQKAGRRTRRRARVTNPSGSPRV
jgi:hypothetical protein